MERPIFYERAEARQIKARAVPTPGSSTIAPECLFEDAQIPAFHVVDVRAPHTWNPLVELYKISSKHGRSYELVLKGMEDVGAWGDEYGTLFTSYSIKGNNLNNPHVQYNGTLPTRNHVYGMQDGYFINRTVRASQELRRLGVEAEMTTRVIEPEELPVGNRNLSIPDFKDELVGRSIAHEWGKFAYLFTFLLKPDGKKRLADIKDFVELVDLRFSVRAMQVPERMWDLAALPTKEALFQAIGRALDFANFSEKLKSEENPEYEADYFDIEKIDDIFRFFGTYVPKKVGRYFAKMHMNGITHGYPHQGNISMVGSIYDLDSVTGEALGLGDVVTADDYANDISQLILGSEVLNSEGFYKLLGINEVAASVLNMQYVHTLEMSYLEGIDPDKITPELANGLITIVGYLIDSDYFSDPIEEWVDNLINKYHLRVSINRLVTFRNILASYEQEQGVALSNGKFRKSEPLSSFIDRVFVHNFNEFPEKYFPNPFIRDLLRIRESSSLKSWTRVDKETNEILARIEEARRGQEIEEDV